MPNLWFIRAEEAKYAQHFLKGGYMAIGWKQIGEMSSITDRTQLYSLYKESYPDESSNSVIGNHVGQLARFLLEIQPGDYVMTRDLDIQWLHWANVGADSTYYYDSDDDGCPFRHRRKVDWSGQRLNRYSLSFPMQRSLKSSLTVFSVDHANEFFNAIGEHQLVNAQPIGKPDPYVEVLERVRSISDKEFELLIKHLLAAIGFDAEHTGKPHDGGVDARGTLEIAGMAVVKLYVQAKQYKLGARISSQKVKQLRMSIPNNGQGAFITTADYDKKCESVAQDAEFQRIGLINGRQLVDLLVEHWDDLPPDFQEKLGLKLKKSLVRM